MISKFWIDSLYNCPGDPRKRHLLIGKTSCHIEPNVPLLGACPRSNILNFMQFSGKIGKILGLYPPWEILNPSRCVLLICLLSVLVNQTLDTEVIESDWLLLHLIQEITITDWLIGSEMSSWLVECKESIVCWITLWYLVFRNYIKASVGSCDVQIDWFHWYFWAYVC